MTSYIWWKSILFQLKEENSDELKEKALVNDKL